MTVEDYHAGFEETNINYDLSNGGWFEDHYLYLNDEDSKNSTYYYNKTRHDFTLKNTSSQTQKVYAQIHAWADRGYSFSDSTCTFNWNYAMFKINNVHTYTGFEGTYQVIHEL